MPSTSSTPGLAVASLEAGEVKVLQLKGEAQKIFVGDPKVADARPNTGSSIVLVANAPGNTTLIASNDDGDIVGEYYIVVTPASGATRRAQSNIHRGGGASVRLSRTGNGARLSGETDTAFHADEALNTAAADLPAGSIITNDLRIRESLQVNLRVRIVEMSRELTRALGVNWKNLGGDIGSIAKLGLTSSTSLVDAASGSSRIAAAIKNTSIEAVIDAMSQEHIVRTLAEPNLTTVSGQAANFLVGGEFPVPISANLGQVSVQFKTYGVSLSFLPTVLSSGQINLKVRPEVSYLTDQGSVKISSGNDQSLTIPALNVRRAETTVQLGSGESFAIAGLMRDVASSSNSVTPFIGDLPILGALFRSDKFQHEQSELVIIVTPYIVRPVSTQKELHTPDENYKAADEAERIFALSHRRANASGQTASGAMQSPMARLAASGGGAVDDVSNVYQARGAAPLRAPTPLEEPLDDESDGLKDLTPSLTVRSRPKGGYSGGLQLPTDVNFQE